jgi:hypothetical protein
MTPQKRIKLVMALVWALAAGALSADLPRGPALICLNLLNLTLNASRVPRWFAM